MDRQGSPRIGSSVALGGIIRDISQGLAYELVSIVQSCQHFQGNIAVMQLFHAPSSNVSISFKSDLCLTTFGLQILLTLYLSEERQI